MAQASPYHPLSGESYIRLLEIGPNGAYGPHDEINHITCSLYEVDIRRCTYEHSIFTALSYAWGSEDDPKQITLNGVVIALRRNLYDFLVHALRQGWVRQIWIDALCINQIDEAEKSKQVAMMGEIYSRASRVLIWLGSLDNVGSDSLIELTTRNKDIATRYGTLSAKDLISKMTPWELKRYLISRESFDSWNPDAEYRHGLVRILQNPYGRRKWIIQEVLLSGPNAFIITHDESIPITQVAREIYLFLTWFHNAAVYPEFMKYLVDSASDTSLDSEEQIYARERMSLVRALGYTEKRGKPSLNGNLLSFWELVVDVKMTYKTRPLMQLVDKFRNHLCSDPRDNIYAFLGLSTL